MPEAPCFSSLLISRPRRSGLTGLKLLPLSLAVTAHLLTGLALLISQFLVLESMQPAGAGIQEPSLVLLVPPRGGASGRGERPAAPSTNRSAGGSGRRTNRHSRRPDSAPPRAIAPPEAGPIDAGDGPLETVPGTGGDPGGSGGTSKFGGDCWSDCGDGPAGPPGSGDHGWPLDYFQEGDPRLFPPSLIPSSRILPQFPDMARRARLEGTVLLLIVVRQDGTVGAIEVVRSPDPRLGFDLAAIEAVKQWRYEPARMHGRPVAVQATVMVEFIISR